MGREKEVKRKIKGEEKKEKRGIKRWNDFRFGGFNINMFLSKTHNFIYIYIVIVIYIYIF